MLLWEARAGAQILDCFLICFLCLSLEFLIFWALATHSPSGGDDSARAVLERQLCIRAHFLKIAAQITQEIKSLSINHERRKTSRRAETDKIIDKNGDVRG